MKLYLDKNLSSNGEYYAYGYNDDDICVFKTSCQKYEVTKYWVYFYSMPPYGAETMLSTELISKIYIDDNGKIRELKQKHLMVG